jgi:hypothetical protein
MTAIGGVMSNGVCGESSAVMGAKPEKQAVEPRVIPFLTPAETERLALLMEEMGEAQQMIGKILRHGYESYHPDDPEKTTNRSLLAREMGHVWAAMQLMIIPQDISGNIIEWSRAEKRETVKRWLHHQG